MPTLPKFLGDFMESSFKGNFAKVSVKSIKILSANLKAITFEGNFKNINYKIGQAILIRVDDTNFRNYTPSYWDNANKQFEVVFHIHGKGIGSQYINSLKLNDTVSISMARGFGLYKVQYKYHFFFGDES
ncbi:MAG: FAD-binding oxidoreductase, partial [Bacteroidia bacterium]